MFMRVWAAVEETLSQSAPHKEVGPVFPVFAEFTETENERNPKATPPARIKLQLETQAPFVASLSESPESSW
jgi:hypothetical protein